MNERAIPDGRTETEILNSLSLNRCHHFVARELSLNSGLIESLLFVGEPMRVCPCCGRKYRGESYPSLIYTEGAVCYTCRSVESDVARGYGSNIEQDALILRQFELAQNFLNRQRINDLQLNEWVEAMYSELLRDIVELLKSRVIGSKKPKRVEESINRIYRLYGRGQG